jgi:hypothetical protein
LSSSKPSPPKPPSPPSKALDVVVRVVVVGASRKVIFLSLLREKKIQKFPSFGNGANETLKIKFMQFFLPLMHFSRFSSSLDFWLC